MKCAICNRLTLKPALVVNGRAIGPVCARKRGLLPTQSRRVRHEVKRDLRTLDLFD